MDNKKLLNTLYVLGEGSKENGDNINNAIISNLKNLKINLWSNLK